MNRLFRIRREAGVGIVTAIFLLVVLAGLGVAMVGIYTAQQVSANVDLMGAQAYQAARAGLEWGIYKARARACTPAAPIRTSFKMPSGSSLSAFTVYVSCTAQGAAPLVRYLVTADACNMPDSTGACPLVNNPESVRRSLEAEL